MFGLYRALFRRTFFVDAREIHLQCFVAFFPPFVAAAHPLLNSTL